MRANRFAMLSIVAVTAALLAGAAMAQGPRGERGGGMWGNDGPGMGMGAGLFRPKPMITQCTAALPGASLVHLKVRCANWMCMPRRYSSLHSTPTCSPWVMELVDTKAQRMRSARGFVLPLQGDEDVLDAGRLAFAGEAGVLKLALVRAGEAFLAAGQVLRGLQVPAGDVIQHAGALAMPPATFQSPGAAACVLNAWRR